jgi:uncharacterized protein (TIGR00369 family)
MIGLTLVYTSYQAERKMSIIEKCDQDQFAIGESNCDLRVNLDLTKPETECDVEATERQPGARPEEFPAAIGKLLGLKLLQAENGMAVVEFVADERHANPMGTLTGGVLCEIADAAMGFAYYTTLAADESFTALELKINFLRPVWKATLRAKARVVRAGKLVGLVECDVVDERKRLIARASITCLTLRGHLAEGRRPPALLTRGSEA